MQERKKACLAVTSLFGLALLLASSHSVAQDKPKREEFQAQAMGQGTQMGQTFSVTLIIEEYWRAIGIEPTSEAWEALNKTLKAIELAALSFPSDSLNWKLNGN